MEGADLIRAQGSLYSHIPAAGITESRQDQGVADSIRQDTGATTPQHLAKLRHTSWQPGERLLQSAVADDGVSKAAHGVKLTMQPQSSASCFVEASQASGWRLWKQEHAQGTYARYTASSRRVSLP